MTAKHVVSDDLFGKLSKRIRDFERRVLEGTISVHDALDAVQGFLEGKSNSVQSFSPDAKLDEVLAEIAKDRSKFDHQRGVGESTFDHLKVGRRYLTKYCCGVPTLQILVYYLNSRGRVYTGADEQVCTTCWRHHSLVWD
jgi:hypothetical protein